MCIRDSTRVVSELGNMSIVELLLQGKTTTPVDLVKDLPGNDEAKAETIDNNLQLSLIHIRAIKKQKMGKAKRPKIEKMST